MTDEIFYPVRTDSQNRITIPFNIRRKFKIYSGDTIWLVRDKDQLRVCTVEDYLKFMSKNV